MIYAFEQEGVLFDIQDPSSVVANMDQTMYNRLKAEKRIFDGMLPKIDNAFLALAGGVISVIIGKAEQLNALIKGNAGTTIKL